MAQILADRLVDTLMKNPEMMGDVAKFAMDNPEIAKAAMSMFSTSEHPAPH